MRARTPVHVQLLGLGSCSHDFISRASTRCVVPLTLHLRNTLATPAAVRVDVGRTPEGQATAMLPTWTGATAAGGANSHEGVMGALAPTRGHEWCGPTRLSVPRLDGNSSVALPLQVATLTPGTLALSDYWVTWSYADMPALSGTRQGPPCYITVAQAPHLL